MSAWPNSTRSFGGRGRTVPKLILSVDDEAETLRSRQIVLENAGYGVLNASSGEQALGIFSTVQLDLAVLDYSLPGVGGREVAKVMKARRPELPIILVSGHRVGIETFSCVDGFLVKGESPALLLETIEELLNANSTVLSLDGMEPVEGGDGCPECWEKLATLASTEQDPEKLLALASEIDRLLQEQGKDRNSSDDAAQRATTASNRRMQSKTPLQDDGPNTTNSK